MINFPDSKLKETYMALICHESLVMSLKIGGHMSGYLSL